MHILKTGALAALPLALALTACSSKTVVETPAPETASAEPAVAETTTTTTVVTTTDSAAAETPGYAAMASGAQTFELTAVNNSGFTGTVVLTPMGEKTTAAVTLVAPANTDIAEDHDTRIYTGTCDAPGEVVNELDDVVANGEASNSEVELAIGTIMNGSHIVQVLEDDGDRAVACAEIPAS